MNNGKLSYLVAVINADANTFSLQRFNGSSFVTELELNLIASNFALDLSKWYSISLTPTIGTGSSVDIRGELTDIVSSQRVTFNTSVANYGNLAGSTGLFADSTIAYFNKITIE